MEIYELNLVLILLGKTEFFAENVFFFCLKSNFNLQTDFNQQNAFAMEVLKVFISSFPLWKLTKLPKPRFGKLYSNVKQIQLTKNIYLLLQICQLFEYIIQVRNIRLKKNIQLSSKMRKS